MNACASSKPTSLAGRGREKTSSYGTQAQTGKRALSIRCQSDVVYTTIDSTKVAAIDSEVVSFSEVHVHRRGDCDLEMAPVGFIDEADEKRCYYNRAQVNSMSRKSEMTSKIAWLCLSV